ncbi:hypothetical protein CLOM_g17109 [Closterium sp. NIES-68]|nr:hypothetical protein CLOM_g17109 [Closterium sp. NIES-68]
MRLLPREHFGGLERADGSLLLLPYLLAFPNLAPTHTIPTSDVLCAARGWSSPGARQRKTQHRRFPRRFRGNQD